MSNNEKVFDAVRRIIENAKTIEELMAPPPVSPTEPPKDPPTDPPVEPLPPLTTFTAEYVAEKMLAFRITPVSGGDFGQLGLRPDITNSDNGWDEWVSRSIKDLQGFVGDSIKHCTVISVRPFGDPGGVFHPDAQLVAKAMGQEALLKGCVEAYGKLVDHVGRLILNFGSPDNHKYKYPWGDPVSEAESQGRLVEVMQWFAPILDKVGVALDKSAPWGKGSATWWWASLFASRGAWPIMYEATGPVGNPWLTTRYDCICRYRTMVARADDTEKFAGVGDVEGRVFVAFMGDPVESLEKAMDVMLNPKMVVYTTTAQWRRWGIGGVNALTIRLNEYLKQKHAATPPTT